MTFDKEYFSGTTSPIDYGSLSYRVTMWLRVRALLRLLRKHGRFAGSLVDVGCALGDFVHRFASAGFQAVGCDVSRWVTVKAKRHHPRLTIVRADAASLPFREDTFTVATMLETLEHCEQPRRIVAEVHRVLASSGLAIISVPTTDLNDTRADATHRWHWSGKEWQDLFHREFRVVELAYFLKRLRYLNRSIANTFFVLTS